MSDISQAIVKYASLLYALVDLDEDYPLPTLLWPTKTCHDPLILDRNPIEIITGIRMETLRYKIG
jgi:hypothetical protein